MEAKPRTAKALVPEFTVGDRLRKARMSRNLLREEVCALDPANEITPRMLGNFEVGITIPKDSMVAKLAALLETDKIWLLTGSATSQEIPLTKRRKSRLGVVSEEIELPDTARRLELLENLLLAVATDNEKFAAFVAPVIELSNQSAIEGSSEGSGV